MIILLGFFSLLPMCYLSATFCQSALYQEANRAMKAKLSESYVKALKPPASSQIDYWDEGFTGFGVRVSERGRRTWQCLFRVNGIQRRKKLGTWPIMNFDKARAAAIVMLGNAQQGIDAVEEGRKAKRDAREAVSFEELAERYLEWAKKNKSERSRHEDARIINLDLLPAWKGLMVREITRRDIRDVLAAIEARSAGQPKGGAIMINRTVALISKLLNFAVEEEIISMVPPLKGLRSKEVARERSLSEEEIRAFWLAVEDPESNPNAADFFKLSLLTAQREGEIHDMTTRELDLERGWWNLPASRTKARRAHRVPLVGKALEIVRRLAAASDDGFLFPWSHDSRPQVMRELHPIRERAGVEAFTAHDLRRTATTHMRRLGLRETVSRILNHAPKDITDRVYDQYAYDAEKRAALLAWDREVSRIVSGQEPTAEKVVSIR